MVSKIHKSQKSQKLARDRAKIWLGIYGFEKNTDKNDKHALIFATFSLFSMFFDKVGKPPF